MSLPERVAVFMVGVAIFGAAFGALVGLFVRANRDDLERERGELRDRLLAIGEELRGGLRRRR